MSDFSINNFSVVRNSERKIANFDLFVDGIQINSLILNRLDQDPTRLCVFMPNLNQSQRRSATLPHALYIAVTEKAVAIYAAMTGEGAYTASEARQSARDPWLNETLTRAGI